MSCLTLPRCDISTKSAVRVFVRIRIFSIMETSLKRLCLITIVPDCTMSNGTLRENVGVAATSNPQYQDLLLLRNYLHNSASGQPTGMPSVEPSLAVGVQEVVTRGRCMQSSRISSFVEPSLDQVARSRGTIGPSEGLEPCRRVGCCADSGGKASEDLKRRVLYHEPVSTVCTTPLNFVLSGPSKNGPIQDQQNDWKTLKIGDGH